MLISSNQQRRPGNIDDLPEFPRATAHVAVGTHRMRPLALLGLLLLGIFMMACPPEASAKVQLFRRTAQKLLPAPPPPPPERPVIDGLRATLSMRQAYDETLIKSPRAAAFRQLLGIAKSEYWRAS